MNEESRGQDREKTNSPFSFRWAEDPFTDTKVLEPESFMEGNDSSLSDAGDLLEDSVNDCFQDTPAGVGFEESLGPRETTKAPKQSSGKKRSLGANENKQSQSNQVSRRKKKPKGMPKRPLSAYNLYFQSERAKILAAAENGGAKIGFEGLGKIIGKKWRELESAEKKVYDKLAEKDSVRYRKEMEAYNDLKAKKVHDEEKQAANNSYESSAASPRIDPLSLQQDTRRPFDVVSTYGQVRSNASVGFKPESVYQNNTGSQILSNTSQHEQFPRSSVPLPAHASGQAHTAAGRYQGFVQVETNQPTYQNHFNNDAGAQRSRAAQSASPPNIMYNVSVPPPPARADQVNAPDSFPIPPLMEIQLNDRKYRVQYSCYSMPREAAHKYIESFTGAKPPSSNSPSSNTPYQGQW